MSDNINENLVKMLKSYLDDKDMTREELGQAIGVPYTTVASWMQGKSYPRAKTMEKLADYFGVTISDLVGDKTDRPHYRVYPVLGEITAGWDAYTFAEEKIDDEAIPDSWITDDPENYCVLQIRGGSMMPELKSGDRVLLHKTSHVPSGTIACVLYDTDKATLKRVVYRPGEDWLELLPISNSPEYAPLRIEGSDLEKCKVVGEVVRLIRKY